MKTNPRTKIVLLFRTARLPKLRGWEAPDRRGARLLQLSFLLAIVLAFPVPFLAQGTSDNALTNDDVSRMLKAGISENIIVRDIQTSRTDFSTSPQALIELRKQGASDGILGAVLESRLDSSKSRGEPLPSQRVLAQSAARPHHLPSFEADMKFKSATLGKISMSNNQIKFERSGVPLFSLKWKEKAPSE